jgi:uncharacterized damage-inducible protein DinB
MKDQFFVDYLERLENLNRHIHQEIENLPDEAMDWAPGSGMNSAAILLAHTAGSLRYWIGDVVLGDPSDRVREREFQIRGQTKKELLGNLEAVLDYVRRALPALSVGDLEKMGHRKPGEDPRTCGWALLHALEHGYLHLGHLELTCQLWTQRSES